MTAIKTIVILTAAALAVSACGDKPSEKKAATQVAAKVNSGEISVHQINFVLQRTPNLQPAQAEAAKKQILENLVDQELAVQGAVEAKLDRDPNILQALEAARREVLARAYVERQVGNKGKPAAEEVGKYYNEHPELFANRKIYKLEEIGFAATPDNLAAAREALAKAKNMQEVVVAFKAKNIQANGGATVKPAEDISLEILPKLAAQKEGQPQLIEAEGKAAIINVVATKPEPLTEAQATPIVERFLFNRDRIDRVREVMKQLRQNAKIEYQGEFAAAKPAAAAEAAPTPASAQAKPQDAAINKGIAGLK